MALIECPECKNQVSDQAKACPNCGFDIQKWTSKQRSKKRTKFWLFLLLAVVFLGPCISAMVSLSPSEPYSSYQHSTENLQAFREQTIQGLPHLKEDAEQAVKEFQQSGVLLKIESKGNKITAYVDGVKFQLEKSTLFSIDIKDGVPIMPASVIYYQAEKEDKNPQSIELYIKDANTGELLYKYKVADKNKITAIR